MNNDATSKTEQIFRLKSPWNNQYQGGALRVLFVCSAGLLRSPSGAAWAITKRGWNARSCGSEDFALIPISPELIMWARRIVFVNSENFGSVLKKFDGAQVEYYEDLVGYVAKPIVELIREKAVVLDVPDVYDYGDAELFKYFDNAAERIMEGVHNLIAYPDSEYPDQWIGAEVTGQQGESK